MAVEQKARFNLDNKRDALIGLLLIVTLVLGGLAWHQNQELNTLEARLSSPECYTAFGNVYQQCLADWLPWYDGTSGGLAE